MRSEFILTALLFNLLMQYMCQIQDDQGRSMQHAVLCIMHLPQSRQAAAGRICPLAAERIIG
jgi:hypothetical protein